MDNVNTENHVDSLLWRIKALRSGQKNSELANVEDFDGEIVAVLELQGGSKLLAIQLLESFVLARVDSALNLDPNFAQGAGYIEDVFDDSDRGYSASYRILLRSDGILLTGEYFDFQDIRIKAALAKYTFDGAVDNSFGAEGKLVLELPATKDDTGRALLNRSAQLLSKMAQRSPAGHVVLDGDKIVLALLDATLENNDGITQLIRLNADGSFDTSFNDTGVVHVTVGGAEINPSGVHVLAGGRLLVYGGSQPFNESGYALIVCYTQKGALDHSFNPDPESPGFIAIGEPGQRARFGALTIDDQGDIFAIGDQDRAVLMAHLKEDGQPEPSFNEGQPLRFFLPGEELLLDRLYAAHWQGMNLVIAGTAFQSRERRGLLMRLTRSGELDGGFAAGQGFSIAALNSEYFDMIIEPDNNILTAGFYADPKDHAWLKRHGANGENATQTVLATKTSASTWLRATPARNRRLA